MGRDGPPPSDLINGDGGVSVLAGSQDDYIHFVTKTFTPKFITLLLF